MTSLEVQGWLVIWILVAANDGLDNPGLALLIPAVTVTLEFSGVTIVVNRGISAGLAPRVVTALHLPGKDPTQKTR